MCFYSVKTQYYVSKCFRVRKILSIKLFNDESEKKWKKSVSDRDLEILCVSQFTLYNTWKVSFNRHSPVLKL